MAKAETAKLTLFIQGMDCAECSVQIEEFLKEMKGVASASVNYVTNKAVVEFDPRKTNPQAIMARIRELGYAVRW
ncbi:MAG: heavy metal-associated domain-containing protein [Candidatus Micrarchaeia archaeon]